MSRVERSNYYQVLEISPHADEQILYEGYVKAKNAYSKDSMAMYSLLGKDECEKMLEMIEEAYSILSDPEKRRSYDQARGIVSNFRPSERPMVERQASLAAAIEAAALNEQRPAISKLVATKRYSLDYAFDQEIEKEIEMASEFSGDFLRKVREYKKVDLLRLSDMTKVAKGHLQNIEDENFSALPALAYTRGFIYQYAKCLKLNPDLVVNSYMNRYKKALKVS